MNEKELNLRLKYTLLERTVTEAINLINWGLNFFNQTNFANANQFYTLYFLNTSLGFELLMKSMICYKEYKDKGSFKIDLKKYSHNLLALKDKILENYQDLPQGRNSQEERMLFKIKEDHIFISKDNDFLRVLEILSSYGLGGRYCKLDFITSNNCKQMDPELEINKFIIDLLDKKDTNLRNKLINSIDDDENLSNATDVWQEVIKKYINPKLKRFLEALSRQFAYGRLGKEARILVGKYSNMFPDY